MAQRDGTPLTMAENTVDSDDDAHTAEKKRQIKILKSVGVSAAEIDDLEHVFEHYDPDANGKVTAKDIKKLLTKLGQRTTDRDISVIIRRLSNGHSKTELNMSQFCLMLRNHMLMNDEPLRAYYSTVLDADGSGELNPKELKRCMKRIGEKISTYECKEMLREVESEDEFVKLCSNVGKGRLIDW